MESQSIDETLLLDKYLSPTVRHSIEEAYYAKISQNAELSHIEDDPLFLASPLKHISFSLDHGIIHVRDIAVRVLMLLDTLNGIHFPKRQASRLDFMKGYGAMLAYVHDIGMINVTSIEKNQHAQLSSQMIFSDEFDRQLSFLWEENSGNAAWRITQLAFKKAITTPPHLVLREMLALACAHHADVVTVEELNYPAQLRKRMQEILEMPISGQKSDLKIYYDDETTFEQDAFQWLVSTNPEVRELVDDVLDTVRALRCANAGRSRGERLRATGGYQIFLDHHSANAIYAVNVGEQLFLMEAKNPLLAGETNLSSTEFTPSGDLRISFYRGNFVEKESIDRAVFNAALAVNDVQDHMIGSFARPPAGDNNAGADYLKKWKPVSILLENCDDNEAFATRVQEQLTLLNPALKATLRVVPSLQNAAEVERNRYLMAKELDDWNVKIEKDVLEKIAYSGHKIVGINPAMAFNHVKCAEIKAGEILIQAGTAASFVYIPMADGLTGYPLGGYEPFHCRPFIPVGNVGVIRGDNRNATIVAETIVNVLMIPKEVYLNFWHHTYSEEEFSKIMASRKSKAVNV